MAEDLPSTSPKKSIPYSLHLLKLQGWTENLLVDLTNHAGKEFPSVYIRCASPFNSRKRFKEECFIDISLPSR